MHACVAAAGAAEQLLTVCPLSSGDSSPICQNFSPASSRLCMSGGSPYCSLSGSSGSGCVGAAALPRAAAWTHAQMHADEVVHCGLPGIRFYCDLAGPAHCYQNNKHVRGSLAQGAACSCAVQLALCASVTASGDESDQ